MMAKKSFLERVDIALYGRGTRLSDVSALRSELKDYEGKVLPEQMCDEIDAALEERLIELRANPKWAEQAQFYEQAAQERERIAQIYLQKGLDELLHDWANHRAMIKTANSLNPGKDPILPVELGEGWRLRTRSASAEA